LSVVGCGTGDEGPAEPANSTTEASPASPAESDGAERAHRPPTLACYQPGGRQAQPGTADLRRARRLGAERGVLKFCARRVSPAQGGWRRCGRTIDRKRRWGTVEANLDRWRDQFGGKPEKASEQRKEINGLDIALVDFSGEFNDQRGPFAPATTRSGYRMLAAIIPADGELHFVKAVGPEATIAAHADRFQEFIDSVATK
jgi:hypothetical protein